MSTELSANQNVSVAQKNCEQTRSGCLFRPNVDIIESSEELLLRADVPGAAGKDIELDYENGVLTLRAKVEPRQTDRGRCLLREYAVGDYYRAFEINEQIEAENISAECVNGVLTIHLPKARSAKPRRITVTNSH